MTTDCLARFNQYPQAGQLSVQLQKAGFPSHGNPAFLLVGVVPNPPESVKVD